MSEYGMTKRMRDLLEFIEARALTGVPPSYDEMKDHLGLRSKSGIHRLVRALEERGLVNVLRNRARTIMPTQQLKAGIFVVLPPDLDQRLRLIAQTLGTTPEILAARYVWEQVGLPSENPP